MSKIKKTNKNSSKNLLKTNGKFSKGKLFVLLAIFVAIGTVAVRFIFAGQANVYTYDSLRNVNPSLENTYSIVTSPYNSSAKVVQIKSYVSITPSIALAYGAAGSPWTSYYKTEAPSGVGAKVCYWIDRAETYSSDSSVKKDDVKIFRFLLSKATTGGSTPVYEFTPDGKLIDSSTVPIEDTKNRKNFWSLNELRFVLASQGQQQNTSGVARGVLCNNVPMAKGENVALYAWTEAFFGYSKALTVPDVTSSTWLSAISIETF